MGEKELIRGKSSPGYETFFIIMIVIGALILFGGGIVPKIGVIISVLGFFLLVFSVIMSIYVSNCELIVTNKRVYGRAAFGKRVDLPVDSISAVSL